MRVPIILRWLLTPKATVGVCAVIIPTDHVLLAQHTYKRKCPWQLPGGHLKAGEHPVDGLRREVTEELGMDAGRCELLHIEAQPLRHLTIFYKVEVSGIFRPSAEVAAVRWSLWDDLPVELPVDQRRAILLALNP